MELKLQIVPVKIRPHTSFNRTAYGIEMEALFAILFFSVSFNRTAYGIEIEIFGIILHSL